MHPGRPAALRRGPGRQRAVHGRRGAEEAEQEQEVGEEAGEEVRRLPGLRVADQADSQAVGPWLEQGGQVPRSPGPLRVHDPEDRRGQGHHQVPDEEGAVPVRRRRPRQHERGRARPEHPLVHQLLGVAAKEALAERPFAPHQVDHGTAPAVVLSCTFSIVVEQ